MTIGTPDGEVFDNELEYTLASVPSTMPPEANRKPADALESTSDTQVVGGSGIPGLPPIGHDSPPLVPMQSPNLEILRQIKQLPIQRPGPDIIKGGWEDIPIGRRTLAHHEQSETIQNDQGEWVNIYGRNTPKAGQQLPDTPTYPTMEDAVDAARKRSNEYHEPSPTKTDEGPMSFVPGQQYAMMKRRDILDQAVGRGEGSAGGGRISTPEQITSRTMDVIRGIQRENVPKVQEAVSKLKMDVTEKAGNTRLSFKDPTGNEIGFLEVHPVRGGRDLKVGYAHRTMDYTKDEPSSFAKPAERGGKSILEGSGAMPDMIRMIREQFPKVERIFGTRVSGVLQKREGQEAPKYYLNQYIRIRDPQEPVVRVDTEYGKFDVPESALANFNRRLGSKYYSDAPKRKIIDGLLELGAERVF